MAPVAAVLIHRECPVSREIYTAGARHVARFFIDRTKGFYSPSLSVDEIRYTVPGGPADEMTELFATIMTSGSD